MTPADDPSPDAGLEEAALAATMLRHTRDAILLTDAELDSPGPRILYANPAFSAMTGHDRATVIGHHPRFLQTAETDRDELDRLRCALERGQPTRSVLLNQRADGSDLWVELDMAPLRDADGTVTHFVAVQRDVTERVRHERMVAIGSDHVHDLLGVLDGDGTVREITPAAWRVLGRPPADVVGTCLWDLFDPDDVADLRDGADDKELLLRARHADGAWRTLEVELSTHFDDPAVRGVVFTARDVTTREHTRRQLWQATEQLRVAVDAGGLGTWQFEMDTGRLEHDRRTAELFGLDPDAEDLPPQAFADRVHADDREPLRQTVRHVLATGTGFERTLRVHHTGDTVRWLLVRGDAAPTAEGLSARLHGVVMDVTERREVTEQVTRALESVTDGYLALDGHWRITYLNARAEQLLGAPRDQLIGEVVWEAFPEMRGSAFERCYRHAASTGESVVFEAFYPPHDRWYQVRVFPSAQGVVVYFHDVTSRVRADAEQQRLLAAERTARRDAEAARSELAHSAAHDGLTGLLNRTELERYVDDLLGSPASPTSLLFFDLDDFKVINDSLGHAVGDSVLCQIGARLTFHCPEASVVARFGGDEFIVVLVDDDAGQGLMVADRLRQHLLEPYETGGRTVTLSASVGVAIASDGDTADTLIRNADTALSAAKRGGRDQIAVYDEGLHHRAVQRLETENDLRATDHGQQLELYYQPIFSLADGQRIGSEALLRWHHPHWGLLTPAAFIDIAEDTGLIVSIGAWVLDQACATIAAHRAAAGGGDGDTVWVNVSAPQLVRPDFVELVAAALAEHEVRGGELGIELTERSLITDPEIVADHLARLHELGVGIAVDDFGTGYSSMTALQRYPIDVLKIDQAFVSRLDRPDGRAIVAATVQLAHALGATASAEGVETDVQLATLRTVGCDSAAGFLLASPQALDRPLPQRLAE